MGKAPELQCGECRKIVRALYEASRDDRLALRSRLGKVARASGRDIQQFGIDWVFSIAAMPDDEMKALMDAHHPHLAEATRLRLEHEAASGHSLKGWWIALQYAPYERE
jgi:hypothetical protein